MKAMLLAILRLFCRLFYPTYDLSAYRVHPLTVFKYGFMQKILGFNRRVPWPVHFTSIVVGHEKIIRRPGASALGMMPGCYIQAINGIEIGSGTRTGPGIKIISADHDITDIDSHLPSGPVVIGDGCWIGANAVLLPGVVLGPNVVVGAGAVVTASFPEGYCVLGGVPAKVIKHLDPASFSHTKSE
jgi:hypothetical protein